MVGYDEQNPFAPVISSRQCLGDELRDLRLVHRAVDRTNLKSGVLHGNRLAMGHGKSHPARVQMRLKEQHETAVRLLM